MSDLVQAHPSGGYILDEMFVGMTAEKHVEITEARIVQFAEASDDFNPVHMDETYAAKTAYRGRIAHGRDYAKSWRWRLSSLDDISEEIRQWLKKLAFAYARIPFSHEQGKEYGWNWK